jgi:hypothetical protein
VRKSRTPGSVRGYPVTGIPTATYLTACYNQVGKFYRFSTICSAVQLPTNAIYSVCWLLLSQCPLTGRVAAGAGRAWPVAPVSPGFRRLSPGVRFSPASRLPCPDWHMPGK